MQNHVEPNVEDVDLAARRLSNATLLADSRIMSVFVAFAGASSLGCAARVAFFDRSCRRAGRTDGASMHPFISSPRGSRARRR